MHLPTMIKESTTLAQLLELEKKFSFNEHEKTLIFEQRISILGRLMQWGVENEAMGLVGSISDSWTPEQRQQFIEDWMDDEPLIQEGFGKKRSYDEMRDDDSGTSTEVRDDKTYFIVTDLKQVRVRRFATTGLDYTIKFTDTLANLLTWNYGSITRVYTRYFKACSRPSQRTYLCMIKFVLFCARLNWNILYLYLLCLEKN